MNPIIETCKVIATDMVSMEILLKRLERSLRMLPKHEYDTKDMQRVRTSLKRLRDSINNFKEDLYEL